MCIFWDIVAPSSEQIMHITLYKYTIFSSRLVCESDYYRKHQSLQKNYTI